MSYEVLRWDSDFFRFPIGRVTASVGVGAIADTVARADADGIRCLYHLVSADDLEALHTALAQDFSPYDIRIEFERPLAPPAPRGVPVDIRAALPADEAVVARLASETITATRFTLDHHFPQDRISCLYAAWVKRGLESGDARRVLLAHPAAGFVICGIDPQKCVGHIELVAVAPRFAGRQIGRALMDEAHRVMIQAGCGETRVVTQGRNVAAQRLYQGSATTHELSLGGFTGGGNASPKGAVMIEAARARPAAGAAMHRWFGDAALLSGLTVLIGLVYWLVHAPLYNPAGTIDPWLYTALFTNFNFTYHHFGNTYYASRLPWVVPGLLVHDVFSYRIAYFVLHGAFFLSGGVALFVLVRRFLGRLPAFAAYAALLGNQLFYVAETWEYVDGAVITYLLLAFACGITEARGRRRPAAVFAAGFFLAAAVATNIFAIVLTPGFLMLYAAVNPLRGHARRLLADGLAIASGAAVLVLAGCIFSRANGEGWWFLGPQLQALGTINFGAARAATYAWVLREPRVIAPLLVLAMGGLVLPRVARRDSQQRRRFRFAVACYAYLLFSAGFLIVYELTGGAALEFPYYESLMFPALALGVASVIFATAVVVHGMTARSRLLLVAVGAALAPVLLVYLGDNPGLVGHTGTWITLGVGIVMVVCVLGGLGRRWSARARVASATVAVGLLVFGVNFSIASSDSTFSEAATNPENGPVYDVGMQLIAFMRRRGFQRDVPYFWYSADDGPELTEIQSLYFYGYTYLGLHMPTVDADFLTAERTYNPRTLVLLCRRVACRGGPLALQQHGFGLREVGRRRLTSGALSVWVRVFRVTHAPAA